MVKPPDTESPCWKFVNTFLSVQSHPVPFSKLDLSSVVWKRVYSRIWLSKRQKYTVILSFFRIEWRIKAVPKRTGISGISHMLPILSVALEQYQILPCPVPIFGLHIHALFVDPVEILGCSGGKREDVRMIAFHRTRLSHSNQWVMMLRIWNLICF